MHKLLLGTAKRVLTIWKKRENILNDSNFTCIQACVDRFVVPSDLGRIPTKISTGFNGFTADQWKHWIIIYSLICMKKYLPDSEFKCWQLYVSAVFIICSSAISASMIETADHCVLQFCELYESLYGEEKCTPNLHLHCHIKQSLINYGPAPSFWLFSFERLNGMLGKFHTNSHSIEVQLMRKFIVSQQIHHYPFKHSSGIDDDLMTILLNAHKSPGSNQLSDRVESTSSSVKLLPQIKQCMFNCSPLNSVSEVLPISI